MAAALLSSRLFPSNSFQFFHGLREPVSISQLSFSMTFSDVRCVIFHRSYSHCLKRIRRRILKPLFAIDSGLEASVMDPKDNKLTFKKVEILVESRDANVLQLRVNMSGEETQKAFDVILSNLACEAPPIPGFRRLKGVQFVEDALNGERKSAVIALYHVTEDQLATNSLQIQIGKTSKVPKGILLNMLGEERVAKFVIQEILTSTLSDYVNKEKLTVKDKKISTTQTEDELKRLFSPGNTFGFNVTMELQT